MARNRCSGPNRSAHRWEARRTPCASLLLSAAAAIVFAIPALAAELEYDRPAIAAGEVWRVVSGHWAHYAPDHFIWDVIAFGFLGVACERRSRSRFLVCVIASALAISLAVWLYLPGIRTYRGLSGVDSALIALLIVELWNEGIRSRRPLQVVFAAAFLIGFLAKISFEAISGNTVFVESSASGAVGVPLAHVIGGAVGFLTGFVHSKVLPFVVPNGLRKADPYRCVS